MDRIIWRDPHGGVVVTMPSPKMMRAFQNGGVGISPPDAPSMDTGDIIAAQGKTKFYSTQMERWTARGVAPGVGQRYARALFAGGCTEAEAFAIIRDKDTYAGEGHIRGPAPALDPFFRDAWQLVGGAVVIDMTRARAVFARKVVKAKPRLARALTEEIEVALIEGRPADRLEAAAEALNKINLRALGQRMLAAETPEALKALVPSLLQEPSEGELPPRHLRRIEAVQIDHREQVFPLPRQPGPPDAVRLRLS